MNKIYLISLGCSRNLVDSEVLQGLLKKEGYVISDAPENADIGIVNTCGFINDAKDESLQVILQMVELKKTGKLKKIIVTGCLSQRYPDQLMEEITEIDAMFGSSDFVKIPASIKAILSGEKVRDVAGTPGYLNDHTSKRISMTPGHYAYLKIQEGCSNMCCYCVIPHLRGPLRSRHIDSLVLETEMLIAEHDIKELIVVAQDTTAFGTDRSGKSELPELLKELSPRMKDRWIRILYTHPAHFSDKMIDIIADTDNICNYIDIPIQHTDDDILKNMNRKMTNREIFTLTAGLRKRIPDAVLRTSVIVGFPGETDTQFENLLKDLENIGFDRLGAFIYSQEEGTPAAKMKGQIPEDVKRERFDRVMRLQQRISSENNLKLINRTLKVLVDAREDGRYLGRSYMDAPEVDGLIYVDADSLDIGEFADVKITGTMEYDLIGEAV